MQLNQPGAPDEDALARFRDAFTALGIPATAPIGLAVSGGPDSLALLLLAKACLPFCAAATVDHGLRPEAAAEARFVAELCGQLSVPHQILTLSGQPEGNVAAWARAARYAALDDWAKANGLQWIATAHHADDQLETLLMRLNRGAGVAGLAGVRMRREMVIRPLLNWRKTELISLVEQAGLAAVDDPSNHDMRTDRARMRQALAKADWLDAQAANRSAQALAAADEALHWAARTVFNERHTIDAKGRLSVDPQNLPQEIQRRLVQLCLETVVPGARPRDDERLRLLNQLEQGGTATLCGVKCTGGQEWQFSKAPPPRAITRKS